MTSSSSNTDRYLLARKRMVQNQIVGRGIRDTRVIDSMMQVRRHDFVDEALKGQAYTDAPLNIGHGQTISQPYIVALMTENLALTGRESVLEIGTGCGYQTFFLAMLSQKVYTIETVRPLGLAARDRLKKAGFRNVVLRIGDGSLGWPEAAPFDRILSACSSPDVPQHLVDQLKEGGFLIVPVARNSDAEQTLLKIERTRSSYRVSDLGACRFVKMMGRKGYTT